MLVRLKVCCPGPCAAPRSLLTVECRCFKLFLCGVDAEKGRRNEPPAVDVDSVKYQLTPGDSGNTVRRQRTALSADVFSR